MKRLFKWFRSHPWYEQIIMRIPALIIALIIAWFIFTLVVFGILYAIEGYKAHTNTNTIEKSLSLSEEQFTHTERSELPNRVAVTIALQHHLTCRSASSGSRCCAIHADCHGAVQRRPGAEADRREDQPLRPAGWVSCLSFQYFDRILCSHLWRSRLGWWRV
jgi:hypothetical protein